MTKATVVCLYRNCAAK